MKLNGNVLSNLIKALNGGKTTEDVTTFMLGLISEENPGIAKALESAMKSGEDPTKYLKDSLKNGTLKASDIDKAEQAYNSISKLGIIKKIPKSTWDEIRGSIKNQDGGFSGF